MKQTYLVHRWNEHTARWDPLTHVQAHSHKQACKLVNLRYPIPLRDLSAKLVPSSEGSPSVKHPPQSGALSHP